VNAGYDVQVITTWPHYNYSADFKKTSTPGFFCRKSRFEGCEVYHVRQKKSKSMLMRLTYILWFHIFFILKSLFMRKYDFVLTPSPPLTSGLLSGIVARLRGAKAIYNVQEVYPDVLIKQGGLNLSIFLKLLSGIEKWTYKLSEKVVTIDEHFSNVIKDRLDPVKLQVIPNFIDTKLYSPYSGKSRSNLKFDGKFLIGYVGNLGKVQDWQAIIEAAKLCESDVDVAFLIVGGGSEFENLKEYEKILKNWTVWPYQARELIPEINSRIDVHLISMNKASDYDGLPSKVFAILSSGRPIIAATNEDSPLARIIKKSGNGVIVERNNAKAIAGAITDARKGLFNEKKSKIGRQFVVDNYSKEVITQQYVKLLDSL
jgi:glycosyltransferase involved in cell wall biosynthesis